MDTTALLSILTELQNDFPTINKVEKFEDQNKIKISLKDFSPKNEEIFHEISAVFFEEPHANNYLAKSYLPNWSRVEVYFTAGTYTLDGSDLDFTLRYLSSLSLLCMLVKVHLIENSENNSGIILCRAVIPLMGNTENFKQDILLALKDLLALHYQVKLNNAISKLEATGLDEETEKSVIERYKNRMQQLINPVTEL